MVKICSTSVKPLLDITSSIVFMGIYWSLSFAISLKEFIIWVIGKLVKSNSKIFKNYSKFINFSYLFLSKDFQSLSYSSCDIS